MCWKKPSLLSSDQSISPRVFQAGSSKLKRANSAWRRAIEATLALPSNTRWRCCVCPPA
ncbi:protein of unknown function [Paraburkholderia kururiensis]